MVARGIHSRPNNGATVHWITPPEIVAALGRFDLGHRFGCQEIRQEAVDAGAAEWTVDSKGVKGFRWKGVGE